MLIISALLVGAFIIGALRRQDVDDDDDFGGGMMIPVNVPNP
jgi:hypothetical protein